MFDVEAARGDVGGDEQIGLAAPEHLHDAVPLPLFHPAVQRLRAAAVRAQRLDERLDFEPRAAEDERGRRVLHVQHAVEDGRLVGARHEIRQLPHTRQFAGRGLLARDRHARRIFQVALRDGQDARRHRGGKQRRLPPLRRRLEDRVEVLREAHVEHFVRFVENEHAQVGELQRPAPDVIERAAGRGDDDAGAALERADLRRNRRAAVDGHHRDADALGVFVDRFGDLHRQLARGDEHEAARVAPAVGVLKERLQHRQREGGRLAGAGRCPGQQVLPGNQQRNRFTLNGCRFFVAERTQGRRQLVDESETAKPAWCAVVFCRAQCDVTPSRNGSCFHDPPGGAPSCLY